MLTSTGQDRSQEPLLSFYMTVRNGADYVERAIVSVQNQTFRNWELVVVDDGSDDVSPLIIQRLAEKDDRIIFLKEKKIGRAAALNLAVGNCKSPIIANIDSDDLAYPNRADAALFFFKRYPECDIIAFSVDKLCKSRLQKTERPSSHDCVLHEVTRSLAFGNAIVHSSVAMKRSFILSIGGYNELLKSQFDYDLWVRCQKVSVPLYKSRQVVGMKRLHKKQSFEKNNRMIYRWRSVKIQSAAIKAAGLSGSPAVVVLVTRAFYCVFVGIVDLAVIIANEIVKFIKRSWKYQPSDQSE